MPPRCDRTQQADATPPPPPPPPQLTPYERATVDMLARITRLLECRSKRLGKSHEEDVAERFRKQGHKEFAGTTDPLVDEEWIRSMETIYNYMGLADAKKIRCAIFMLKGDAALWGKGGVVGLFLESLTWRSSRRCSLRSILLWTPGASLFESS
ncbi:hypothetical protein F511_17418 [Dorcoceras hygrometricum]|uniref:Uncharacterized protein n=1 Tax=Dorcoceras hygrometricum TaxID=472368 RepID=A0A2Z7C7I1_9LAMI|nr:hypothetical protein F511_17418 [Dorcoceras hygrometricum]